MTASPNRSKGAALLVVMLIMTTAIATVAVNALPKHHATGFRSDAAVLQQAKEALINYALLFAEQNPGRAPGFMPCPDMTGDGLSDAPCGILGASTIGRLPWRTLNLPVLRDHDGDCLWYAVSGSFKALPNNTLTLNASGQFLVVDNQWAAVTGSPAIAVIFAPGEASPNQPRNATQGAETQCGSTVPVDPINNPANFMESTATLNNATGLIGGGNLLGNPVTGLMTTGFSAVIKATPGNDFNDQLAAITDTDLVLSFRHLRGWIGNKVRSCLAGYAAANTDRLPWPASLNPLAAPSYTDNPGSLRFGRLPITLTNSAAAGLDPLWIIDPSEPLTRCFTWGWWPSVRENVFYAVDQTYAPIPSGALNLTVNGALESASILIAGRPTAGQNRISNADKSTLTNYLSPANRVDDTVGALPPGTESFTQADLPELLCTLTTCP